MSMLLEELARLKEAKQNARVYTVNGVPVDGKILRFDESGVLIQSEGKTSFVRMDAVSTLSV